MCDICASTDVAANSFFYVRIYIKCRFLLEMYLSLLYSANLCGDNSKVKLSIQLHKLLQLR